MTNNLSKKRELLQRLLSEKQFRSEHLSFVTNRQVHHWKEIGLIDDHRKYAASGLKSSFNFYEALWIRIITEMRTFRISNISIREIKKGIFQIDETITERTPRIFETIQNIILTDETKIL